MFTKYITMHNNNNETENRTSIFRVDKNHSIRDKAHRLPRSSALLERKGEKSAARKKRKRHTQKRTRLLCRME